MDGPRNLHLPFFAYGIFQPGQLGFLRLKRLVATAEPASVRGRVLVRDGLPILDAVGPDEVAGYLVSFLQGGADAAYRAINDIEPAHQYRWDETASGERRVNVLLGRSPNKGSVPLEEGDSKWTGEQDPLLTVALDIVAEMLSENGQSAWDMKPLFRLQAAYLLLWSAIERYLSLRYHLGQDVERKVKALGEEPAFRSALAEYVSVERSVFRADKPQERLRLTAGDAPKAVEYYYQVRCNITHRGKGVPRDHETLTRSLSELLAIFREVLRTAFLDAKWSSSGPA
jgi:hypothetical protein